MDSVKGAEVSACCQQSLIASWVCYRISCLRIHLMSRTIAVPLWSVSSLLIQEKFVHRNGEKQFVLHQILKRGSA